MITAYRLEPVSGDPRGVSLIITRTRSVVGEELLPTVDGGVLKGFWYDTEDNEEVKNFDSIAEAERYVEDVLKPLIEAGL